MFVIRGEARQTKMALEKIVCFTWSSFSAGLLWSLKQLNSLTLFDLRSRMGFDIISRVSALLIYVKCTFFWPLVKFLSFSFM